MAKKQEVEEVVAVEPVVAPEPVSGGKFTYTDEYFDHLMCRRDKQLGKSAVSHVVNAVSPEEATDTVEVKEEGN